MARRPHFLNATRHHEHQRRTQGKGTRIRGPLGPAFWLGIIAAIALMLGAAYVLRR